MKLLAAHNVEKVAAILIVHQENALEEAALVEAVLVQPAVQLNQFHVKNQIARPVHCHNGASGLRAAFHSINLISSLH